MIRSLLYEHIVSFRTFFVGRSDVFFFFEKKRVFVVTKFRVVRYVDESASRSASKRKYK